MDVRIPEEEELRSRILSHLAARPSNQVVAAVWHGYLAGLLEWGLIDPHTDARLCNLLPGFGKVETSEILAGLEFIEANPEFKSPS